MKEQIYFFMKWSLFILMTLLITISGKLHAQDPAQYGTPFAGVPDRMDANIYQMNLREYSTSRNIAGARAKLQRIKDLGINVIYLMPIFPVGVTNNPDGSPYSNSDLKGVASDLGTLTDLRGLVADAHNLGMAVILDFVVNQTAWDHPWISQHPDWYVRDANGVIQPPCPSPGFCFNDVAQINLNNSAAAAAMVDAIRYWIFAANIDGFRFDWADKAPQAFWTNTITNLRGITSHKLLLLAEGSNEGTNSGCTTCGENQPGAHYAQGFDYIFGTNFYWNVMKKVWNAGEPTTNLDGVTTGEYTGASSTQLVARFLSNHDDYNADGSPFSFLSGGRNAAMSAFVVATYHRSVPFIYNGIEVGNTNPLPYPWKTGNINWTQDLTVYTEMQKILNFRNTSVALRRGLPTSYTTSANNNVIAFTKSSGSEKVVVIVNVRNSTQTFTIPAGMAGTYNDAYNVGTAVTLTSGATRTLSPYQYLVLTNANVTPVAVTSVSVSPTSASIKAGLTQQLTASITPSNATNQNVTWSSSNSAVATVNAAGLVTGIATGTANITVTTQDGNKTAVAVITVTPASTFTVHFYKPAIWGTTIRIYWWATQPTGVIADGTWPGVTMTSEGNNWYGYTFTNVTSTNIIFNDGTTQTANLSRAGTNGWYMGGAWYDTQPSAIAVTGVTVSPTTATLNVGGTQQLTATVAPSNATNKTVSWSSSNTAVATVNTSGLVTAIGAGTATITVTTQDGNRTATSVITVTSVQAPYGGSARSIPGTIQVEDFDTGGEGTAYHDNDAGNSGNQYRTTERVDIEVCSEGGYNIGWTNTGEWLEYTVNVATAGNYDIAVRVTSGTSGGNFKILFDNVDKTGTMSIGGTGGWQSWQTVTKTAVALSAGTQVMQLYLNTGDLNINSIAITATPAGGTYYALQNRWTNAYLFDNGTNVGYGASITNNSYKWEKVVVDATYFYLRNLGTGEYMHIENQTGSVQSSAITQGWWSAQWSQDYIDGTWVRFRNRWQTGSIIHVENQTGSAQYAGAQDGWYSAQWRLVSTSGRLAGEAQTVIELLEESIVEIYPNPSRGNQLTLIIPGLGENEVADVVIRDMNGRVVMQRKVDRSGKLDHTLSTGLYIVRVKTNSINTFKKLMVER